MCVRCGDLCAVCAWTWNGGVAFPSFFFSLACLPHDSRPLLLLLFIFDGATWAKGSALAPSGVSGDSYIHDSVRYFSEALMALAWSLRRGYYHIGCTRESYWPTKRSSCPCINLIESVVNCTAIRCAPITSPQPPPRYRLISITI
jgi:hypothetical protein